jgi:hypothetical protein
MILRRYFVALRVAPRVPLRIGVRTQIAVCGYFRDRYGRVLSPSREVDELAAIGGNRDACDLMFKGRDLAQPHFMTNVIIRTVLGESA